MTTAGLASELGALLTTERLGRAATVLRSVPSTQALARQMASSGAPEGTLVWALEQTHGRGRLDRAWVSPAGGGLWFSLILRPQLAPAAVPWLTLGAGVASATALGAVSGNRVRLKWPNDLLVGGAKLGGILAEGEINGGSLAFVVLGIGVNLRQPTGGFDPTLVPPPAALAEGAAALPGDAAVLAAIINELEMTYGALKRGEINATRSRWLELSDTIGRRVTAQLADGATEGTAVGLGADGALLIEGDDGVRAEIRFGEVVHLR